MKVEIPVHPVSKKILMKDYGSRDMLATKDVFYSILYLRRPASPNSYKKYKQQLTESVELDINEKLAKRVENQPLDIGWFLWQLHADQMIKFVYAQHLSGESAKQAFRNFYELHDIDEDDYASDTAYKRWQRYIKNEKIEEKTDLFVLQSECSVLSSGQQNHASVIKPTKNEIHVLIGRTLTNGIFMFFKSNGEINVSLFKHLFVYAYVVYGRRDSKKEKKELAESVGRSMRNITYSINQFSNLMDTYPYLEQAYEKAVKSMI